MTIALATLAFLIAGWAALTALLVVMDENGAKILAALRGDSLLAREVLPVHNVTVRFSPRYPAPRSQPVRAEAMRAAA